MVPAGTVDRPPPHLQLHAISFAYGPAPSAFAFHQLSTAIHRGLITGLLGPNGSGKSTLIRMLAGIARPREGSVSFDGQSLSSMSRRDIARRVALVPQSTHPAFDCTAMELVLLGRHPHLAPFTLEGPDDLAIAMTAMAETGTAEFAGRSFHTLSGGEQQRVVLAGALAQQPEVLLLDEPTASLDLGHQLDIAGLLERITRERGVSIVLATHDLSFAARVCDRLVLLREGRVVADGPTAEMLTPDAIGQLYGVEADVTVHTATGRLTVVPRGRVS